jgi:hypothetical protein
MPNPLLRANPIVVKKQITPFWVPTALVGRRARRSEVFPEEPATEVYVI